MLATLAAPGATAAGGFAYEVKYDGFRAVAAVANGQVAVLSRNARDLVQRFSFLRLLANSVRVDEAVLDGEIVGVDARGNSHFEGLGDERFEQLFVAFDLLWLHGKDIRHLPIEERRALLEKLAARAPRPLVLAQPVVGTETEALERARSEGWEGLVAKRHGSQYTGERATNWLKLKVHQSAELAIVGWMPNSGNANDIGALLLGVFDGGKLRYAGRVGSGLNYALRRKLLPLLLADEVRGKSLVADPTEERGARWVKPRHLAQVRFTEWTSDLQLRHPVLQGIREDRPLTAAVVERPLQLAAARQHTQPPASAPVVKMTHPEKVMFPKSGLTKRHVRAYYDMVAPYLLPVLDGRPLSMEQFPDGIAGENFYRLSAGTAPPWVTRATVSDGEKSGERIVVDRPETLSWLANQSALTLHLMPSRVQTPERPDWVIFDFDPVAEDWSVVAPLAQALHGLLDELKLPSYPKTSGKRGLHVMVPLASGHTHEEVHDFAKDVMHVMAAKFSKVATDLRMKRDRRGRLYLDAEQNGRIKTIVAPYSIRALEGAPVSAPLHWGEVTRRLKPAAFNIRTMKKRLERVGDLFAPVLDGRGRLPKRG